ncbi:MAG: DUF4838 domain-containing protein [Clostridia bacterium]|nr:DUF4838 domain-containing protein [Clostridia bacterium]
MKKRLIAVILVVVLVLGIAVFAICKTSTGNKDSESGSSESIPDEYVETTDGDVHLVDESKLLHIKTVNEVGRVFVERGRTEYVIVVGNPSSSAASAADFLSKQIGKCTGAYPEIYLDTNQDLIVDSGLAAGQTLSFNTSVKYIVYSHERLETLANVSWKTGVDLAYSGYMIKSVGNSVFIKVNSLYGYQTASLAFCREVLGYEWYSEDTIVYTKTGATLPDMDIIERPDFDLVDRSGYISSSGRMASGMTVEEIFTYTNGNFCHNSFDYIPPTVYNVNTLEETYHPKWYASGKGSYGNPNATQLCYSAHGDREEYKLLIQTAYEGVMKTLNLYPNAAALTFTRQDEYGNCECETCSLITDEYGSLTATYMMFVNDLDDLVQAELQRQADENETTKRDVTILFFAYRETALAPVSGQDKDSYVVPTVTVSTNGAGEKVNVINKNGATVELPYLRTYENGFKCNKNVGVFYAPINATYEESFYHLQNKEYKVNFEKWGLLTERLYGWIYDTNFVHWLVPYNSFDSIAETLRFLKDNGCQYIFNQAQNNTVCTGFGSLKTYLNMTLSRDVNLNAGTLMDKYFENYFKDAAEPMREYYESLVGHMQQLEIQYPEVFYTQRRTESESAKYWPLAKMQDWLELCDKAYASVEKYKVSNPDLYATLVKHITVETLFPRFMICEYYAGYFDNATIQQMRQSFREDCDLLGYQFYAENVYLSSWFDKWGVA